MTAVEKERLCQQELDELRRLIALDLSAFPADVDAALRFIHAHLFEESLNASRVQRQEGLRSHNLPARFKRHVGQGLRDYIEDRRLMAAMRLLWHREVEIYLVAAAVGYAHHETFTRAFKRRVGCTPSQFRTHFTDTALQLNPPEDPIERAPPAYGPSRSGTPSLESHPREVLMFITDVVGIPTAEETYELRVSGTAGGVGEVSVEVTASGESRSQVATVEPEGRWIALFSGEREVFTCGRPLLVEVGSDGHTQVRWEGLLDCAETAPRRRRSSERVAAGGEHTVAAGREPDPPEPSTPHPQDGGAYAGDAAMTVTVATGRGSAPPPVGDAGEEEEDTPYYKRLRVHRRPAPRKRVSDAEREQAGTAPDESSTASGEDVRNLRQEVAALRAQVDALVPRAGGEPREAGGESAEASDEGQAGASVDARGSSDEATSAVQEQIEALRRELRERWEAREAENVGEPEEETGEATEDDSEAGEEEEGEDEWQRAIRNLQDKIEALREDVAERRQQKGKETSDSPDPDDEACASGEQGSAGDVSPAENRGDLYDAVRALRDRITELETQDDESEQLPSRRRGTERPRAYRDVQREEESKRSGEPPRQPVEEQHPPNESSRAREASSPEREASGRGVRRARGGDAPVVRFEPVEVGEWTREGRRNVRVGARITHPSREPVAAELTVDRDGRVLADGRSERGTLTLDEWVEVEPGTATFTVTVTEPAPASLSMAWTLEEPERGRVAGGGRGQRSDSEDDGEEEVGWGSRAVSGAWGIAVALFLLSLAAGVHGLLRGLVTATFLGFFGSYLALTVPRRWGGWTAAGIGLFAVSLVALLPFTPIIQVDSYLLVAGFAALGLSVAAAVALFVSSD